jgi:hypothetical protein
MPTKRQRDRTAARRRHGRKLNLENLAPKIAAGITQGASAREALAEFPTQASVDGAEIASRQLGGENEGLPGTRIPRPRFVARDDTHSVWTDDGNRLQRNAILAMEEETYLAMKAGYLCLRCLEPHDPPFPGLCDMCGYPMQERQIMDIAMEFRGRDHIGPGAPIADYLAQQDERMERLEHEARKAGGASPMKAISRKILSPGAKRLRGLRGNVHVDEALLKEAERAQED